MNRQKGLTRTRTDLPMVTQFRKTPHRFDCLHVTSYSFFFRFCNKLKLGLLGENFNTGLPQIPFRMCFECVSLVSPMATAQFQHGLLVDPYIGCVFRRAISTVCQFIIAAKYENSGCREVKCICLRSRMKRALHSKMWLRCVKFYVWFWSHDEVAIPHCLLQKFANSGCTN